MIGKTLLTFSNRSNLKTALNLNCYLIPVEIKITIKNL